MLHVLTTGSGGGIERVVHLLSDHLVSLGWDCSVAYWRGTPPAEARASYIRLRRAKYIPTWPRHLVKLMHELKPDIVHLHGPMAGSVGAVSVRFSRVARSIYTEHNIHDRRTFFIRELRRFTSPLPDINTAVSRVAASNLAQGCRLPLETIEVIQNGVPRLPLSPDDSSGGPLKLVYVANFWPRKMHEHLIRAVALSNVRSCEISFFGDGPRRANVSEAANQLGLGLDVTFYGHALDPWSVIRRPAVYVHVAGFEASGLAPMEAMMSGLPVIGYATGGLLDLVEAGEAVHLVPHGDIPALAQAIRAFEEKDPSEIIRLGLEARSFAMEHLTSETMLDGYRALYERLYSSHA